MCTRILIADDHEQNRKMIRIVLQKSGYETVEAVNGEEALRLARETLPAAIILDIQMPLLDGIQVMKILKAAPETAAILIIALTSYAMHGDHERFLAEGFDGYLSKPIDIREFQQVLRELLSRDEGVKNTARPS
jgi:two-component system, cell cycle response regulator DivK